MDTNREITTDENYQEYFTHFDSDMFNPRKWTKKAKADGMNNKEPGITMPSGCAYTQSEDGKHLYLHIFDNLYRFLVFKGIAGKVEYVQFLHDGSEIIYNRTDGSSDCGRLTDD